MTPRESARILIENSDSEVYAGQRSHQPALRALAGSATRIDERSATLGRRLARARPWLSRAVPVVAVLCLLAWCYVSVRSDFSADDADSEILSQAWRLDRGENIYRGVDTPPFAFAAYTPLYYGAVAFLLKFTGLSFLPAKLLSFLAALSIGWAMVCLCRLWNRAAREGLWTTFFLFLIPAFFYNAVRSHPQMMAVAFSVWSLYFFLRDRRWETLVLSPLLAVLAFYTKQTQVALPLAMFAWLALRKRRWLVPYVATTAVAGLIPLLWLQKATGGLFLFDTVQLTRLAYSTLQIVPVFIHHAGPIFLFIGLALRAAWPRFRNGQWDQIDLYFGCALLTTLVSLGRVGAHGQYVLELLVVTLLYLLRTCGLPSVRGRDALVAAQVALLLIYAPLYVSLEEGLHDKACSRAAQIIYPLLKTGTGPILSEQGSFALFGRGEVHVQLFHFAALSRAGLWDQGLLLNEIDRRAFSWVITEFPIEMPISSDMDRERLTPEVLQALRQNYQRRQTVYPYYLYGPSSP